MAAVGARFLSSQLHRAWCRSGHPAVGAPSNPASATAPRPSLADTAPPPPLEICLTRADRLPASYGPNTSWSLHDSGRRKGVQKLGLLSTVVNESLRLALPELERAQNCSTITVTLGYMVGWEGPGDLRLACTGCPCAGRAGRRALDADNPFPVVRTDSFARGYGNVSVTQTTSFLAVQTIGAPCVLEVTHQATSVPARERSASSASSRVRIDSLYVERAGPWDERHIAQAAHSHDVSRRYMEQARHCRPTGWRAWRG